VVLVKKSRIENDCLALLIYISQHPGEYQTEQLLADKLNMSHQRISQLLGRTQRWYGYDDSFIYKTASKYGFFIRLYKNKPGTLIDAVYTGRAKNQE
jgi:hypothetical protein